MSENAILLLGLSWSECYSSCIVKHDYNEALDLTSNMFDLTDLLDDNPNPQTNPLAYIQQAQLTAEIKASGW